jgi:hypothetical protein
LPSMVVSYVPASSASEPWTQRLMPSSRQTTGTRWSSALTGFRHTSLVTNPFACHQRLRRRWKMPRCTLHGWKRGILIPPCGRSEVAVPTLSHIRKFGDNLWKSLQVKLTLTLDGRNTVMNFLKTWISRSSEAEGTFSTGSSKLCSRVSYNI